MPLGDITPTRTKLFGLVSESASVSTLKNLIEIKMADVHRIAKNLRKGRGFDLRCDTGGFDAYLS